MPESTPLFGIWAFMRDFDGQPGPPWEGALLFAGQSGPGRTASTTLGDRVVEAVEDVLGTDAEFFIEDLGLLNDDTWPKCGSFIVTS